MTAYRPGMVALALAALCLLFLLAPLVAVVPISLTPSAYLSLPEDEISFRHYRTLIEAPEWGEAVLLSLGIGLAASAVATVLATAFALGIWFARPRLTAALVGMVLLPMVVPPVVSALTLYFLLTTLSRASAAIGYDSWAGVVLAHAVMVAPFAVVMVLVSLAQVDRRMDMAARGMGASLPTRILSVVLPTIRFGVVSAAFLSFILSWEEIAVTLFITSTNAVTLPRLVWMGLRDNVDPAVAAISVVLIAATVLALATLVALRRTDRSS
jgi:putative spermidine/putrescine transport system permease protein